MEQLSWLEDVPKKSYYGIIVKQLKDYPHLKKALEIEHLHQDREKLEGKRIRVELVESAISQLDHEELQIIQKCYFGKSKPKDTSIMMQLCVSKSYFYKTKDEAIRKIATVLNVL
jgi:ArpU family phage transcriptional regulator